MSYKTCKDIPDFDDCCDTCHIDHDEYGYDFSDYEKDGQEWYVCCKGKIHLEEIYGEEDRK